LNRPWPAGLCTYHHFAGASRHNQRDSPVGARECPVIRSMPLRRPYRPPGQRIRHREIYPSEIIVPFAGLLPLHSRRPGTLPKVIGHDAFSADRNPLPGITLIAWHHADGVTRPGQPVTVGDIRHEHVEAFIVAERAAAAAATPPDSGHSPPMPRKGPSPD
jgi:hypothetical protein